MTDVLSRRAIGGFLPLDAEPRHPDGGALACWGVTSENAWMFSNARSALAYLLREARTRRLLLPAYICPELSALADREMDIHFYPLLDDLSPNTAALASKMRAGDCILAVDYFGRPPSGDFQAFVAEHPEVLWVEDRAQALDPGCAEWAPWVLYSPRKLFGVPDGGILKSTMGSVPAAAYEGGGEAERAGPRILRRDDADERDNEVWYAAYRAVEEAMAVSREPMSQLTCGHLRAIDVEAVCCRRRENFKSLNELLGNAVMADGCTPAYVPFGFPVRVAGRDDVCDRLREKRVFAARYWQSLPSDAAEFPTEHAFGKELLLLPCDHRYDRSDMERVAQIFEEARR